MQWARPGALILLLLIPLILAYWAKTGGRRSQLRLPSAMLYLDLRPSVTQYFRFLPGFLRIFALTGLIFALARPQLRATESEDLSVEGIDVVLALDVSTSMKAADFKPKNRLNVAKKVISEFIEKRKNDRLGLVVFAGEAFTQAPLTLDYPVLMDVLNQIRMGVIEDGTAIGDAIAVSLNRLQSSQAKSRVIILVTDGDSNAGNISPVQAASMAQEMGVKVYTIMVGKGGAVPYPAGRDMWGRISYQQVEIPVNPELLEEISKVTGGQSYVATDQDSLKNRFQAILDDLEKSRLVEGGVFTNYTEVFSLFLLPAVLALLLEFLLRSTRFRSFP